ncbi:THAP domain-containing protein 2-like [Clarias gariepinus]|uniref:THAP domain-containing protein 2-like n=1 Tax=Clarias gariepinus TaxID=13013 RepID=UPI00234DA350|nr:THAP domain-containing protein 2-like [Clarias gariepinus]
MAKVSVSKSKGLQCFAVNCRHYNNSYWREQGITFHKFPDENKFPDTYADWVRKCRREKDPSKHARLCSCHFEAKWFDRTGQTVRLREGAVPDWGKFNLPKHLQPKTVKPRTTATSKRAAESAAQPLPDALPSTETHTSYVEHEHAYAGSALMWKRKFFQLSEKHEDMAREYSNALRREKRAKEICRAFVEELYEKNGINTDKAVFEEILE